MTTTRKRIALAFGLAILVCGVTVFAIVYVYGLPAAVRSLLKRAVTAPTSEDYSVYSAFVDDFFSSKQPFRADQSISQYSIVYVMSKTLEMKNPGSILPIDVAALGPIDMGEDFFRQNALHWNLEQRFHAKLRVLLVGSAAMHRADSFGMRGLFERPEKRESPKWLPHASLGGPFPEQPLVAGVLQLSRVGFNWRKTLALLYYDYRCGVLCGQSGWSVLERSNGKWRVKEFGGGFVL